MDKIKLAGEGKPKVIWDLRERGGVRKEIKRGCTREGGII